MFLVQGRAVENGSVRARDELVRQMCSVVERQTRPAVCASQKCQDKNPRYPNEKNIRAERDLCVVG